MSVVKIRQRPLSEAHVTNISKELINVVYKFIYMFDVESDKNPAN